MGPIERRVQEDPATRRLTKEVLKLAEDRDVVNAYFDVRLALDVLKEKMEYALMIHRNK